MSFLNFEEQKETIIKIREEICIFNLLKRVEEKQRKAGNSQIMKPVKGQKRMMKVTIPSIIGRDEVSCRQGCNWCTHGRISSSHLVQNNFFPPFPKLHFPPIKMQIICFFNRGTSSNFIDKIKLQKGEHQPKDYI